MPTYRFGDFELDLDALQLRRGNQPVRLERRPLDLLIMLVSHQGRMVSREDLIAALWPARVIIDFESGLNTLVRKVRNALGDSTDDPRFIETVPGRGYRFVAPVTEVKAPDAAPAPPAIPQKTSGSRAVPFAALALSLLAGAAVVVFWQSGLEAPSSTRIAVLPFENLTGDDRLDYMAAGLAEETSTSLGQIDLPDLAVIGWASARALADAAPPLKVIGRELDVDFIVQSSLRLEESRIRVTSRLIRVSDDAQIWSAAFDRELTNVLGLQRELSVAIAEQVRQRLSPDVAAAIDRRQTQNPRAYELYLKGRYAWSQFSPGFTQRALQYFEQAVTEDPRYALAWAGIADALAVSPMAADANPQSILPRSQDALQRALEYGPDLAEVQYALCVFHLFVDWDLPAAEAAAREAVTLNPNSAMAYMRLGIVLSTRYRHVEARDAMRRARELDPLFPLLFANSANVALVANDLRSALEFSKQAIAINPEFWVGYQYLGNSELALGDDAAALESYTKAGELSGGNADIVASRAYLLSRLGQEEAVRALLVSLESRAADQYVPPYAFAVIHAALREVDTAFEFLESALEVRDVHLLGIAADSRLDALQSDPRFDSLLRRCGCAPLTDGRG